MPFDFRQRAVQEHVDAGYATLVTTFILDEPLRVLLHALVRARFVEAQHLDDEHFDFAHYLAIALGHTLAEIVEVPVKTWLGLEICLLIFWQINNALYNLYVPLCFVFTRVSGQECDDR